MEVYSLHVGDACLDAMPTGVGGSLGRRIYAYFPACTKNRVGFSGCCGLPMRLAVSGSLLNVWKGTWEILYTPWARGLGTIGPGGKG